MENNEVEEIFDVVEENDNETEINEVNETITEIKEILLENQENSDTSVENEPIQIISTVTEDEFIKFNNSFCTSVLCSIFVIGIVGGLILGKAFQGIFK